MHIFKKPGRKVFDGYQVSWEKEPTKADSYYWLSTRREATTKWNKPTRVDGKLTIAVKGYKSIPTRTWAVDGSAGRLKYIDGCSSTLLVAPPVKGDPCLNYMHVPGQTEQTFHTHPSIRVGLVVSGSGHVDLDGSSVEVIAGDAWVIEADELHRFRTEDDELEVLVFHPDSDFGPTDEVHPMLNKTVIE